MNRERCICYYMNDENVDCIKRYNKLYELYGDIAYIHFALTKQDISVWCKVWKYHFPLEVVMDRIEDVDDVVPFGTIVDLCENYVGV